MVTSTRYSAEPMDIPLLISSLSAAKTLGGALLDERDRQKAAAIQIQLTEKGSTD